MTRRRGTPPLGTLAILAICLLSLSAGSGTAAADNVGKSRPHPGGSMQEVDQVAIGGGETAADHEAPARSRRKGRRAPKSPPVEAIREDPKVGDIGAGAGSDGGRSGEGEGGDGGAQTRDEDASPELPPRPCSVADEPDPDRGQSVEYSPTAAGGAAAEAAMVATHAPGDGRTATSLSTDGEPEIESSTDFSLRGDQQVPGVIPGVTVASLEAADAASTELAGSAAGSAAGGIDGDGLANGSLGEDLVEGNARGSGAKRRPTSGGIGHGGQGSNPTLDAWVEGESVRNVEGPVRRPGSPDQKPRGPASRKESTEPSYAREGGGGKNADQWAAQTEGMPPEEASGAGLASSGGMKLVNTPRKAAKASPIAAATIGASAPRVLEDSAWCVEEACVMPPPELEAQTEKGVVDSETDARNGPSLSEVGLGGAHVDGEATPTVRTSSGRGSRGGRATTSGVAAAGEGGENALDGKIPGALGQDDGRAKPGAVGDPKLGTESRADGACDAHPRANADGVVLDRKSEGCPARISGADEAEGETAQAETTPRLPDLDAGLFPTAGPDRPGPESRGPLMKGAGRNRRKSRSDGIAEEEEGEEDGWGRVYGEEFKAGSRPPAGSVLGMVTLCVLLIIAYVQGKLPAWLPFVGDEPHAGWMGLDTAITSARSRAGSFCSARVGGLSDNAEDLGLPDLVSEEDSTPLSGGGRNGGGLSRRRCARGVVNADGGDDDLMWDTRTKPFDHLVFDPVLGVVPWGVLDAWTRGGVCNGPGGARYASPPSSSPLVSEEDTTDRGDATDGSPPVCSFSAAGSTGVDRKRIKRQLPPVRSTPEWNAWRAARRAAVKLEDGKVENGREAPCGLDGVCKKAAAAATVVAAVAAVGSKAIPRPPKSRTPAAISLHFGEVGGAGGGSSAGREGADGQGGGENCSEITPKASGDVARSSEFTQGLHPASPPMQTC